MPRLRGLWLRSAGVHGPGTDTEALASATGFGKLEVFGGTLTATGSADLAVLLGSPLGSRLTDIGFPVATIYDEGLDVLSDLPDGSAL